MRGEIRTSLPFGLQPGNYKGIGEGDPQQDIEGRPLMSSDLRENAL
jgi:hypothetical protein